MVMILNQPCYSCSSGVVLLLGSDGETWSCKVVAILSLFPFVQEHTFTWDYSSVGGCDEN